MKLILLLIFPAMSFAQDKELFHVSWRYAPGKSDSIGKSKYIEAFVAFPIHKDSLNTFAGALSYRSTYLEAFAPLYGVSLNLAWVHKLNDRHSIIVFAQGGIFSDMRDISGEDMRGTFGIRYSSKHSDRLKSGFGLGYSRQFFGKQIVPFIELNYKISDKFQFYGLIPVRQRLEYSISDKSKAGISLTGDLSSYRLSNAQYMRLGQWGSNLYYQYNFFGNWNISASARLAISQRFEVFDKAESSDWTIFTKRLGKKPVPVYEASQKGLQLQISIAYALP